jgi:outer membrane protein assembly factor BamB
VKDLMCWIVAVVVVACALPARADWPAYRGPRGDGISEEKMLSNWPADGPKVLWKTRLGDSLGSFAIKDGRVYCLGANGTDEECVALDFQTGDKIWTTPLGRTQERRQGQGGNGPGSTPVADGDKVYTYGSRLLLACLNASDGKVVWKHDIQSDFNGQANEARAIRSWGSSSSPIVTGDLVIVQGGGSGQSFIAFNKSTGEVVWKKHTETLTHATPTLATIHDVPQLIFLTQSGLVAIDPKTGELLWKQAYAPATAIAASPVVSGNIVYCSIGYGVGGGAYEISRDGSTFTSKELWRTRGQSLNQWSTPVVKDGYLYSIHGQRNATLQCVDIKTGKVLWNGPQVGQGEVMLIDNKLLVQCADGKLLLADPDPSGFKQIATAQPLRGQSWGWPAFSNGVLVYRTNVEAAAVDLSVN